MNFDFTDEEKKFREKVEEFVKSQVPPDWDDKVVYWPGGYGTNPEMEIEFHNFCHDFVKKLGQKGWMSLGWPEKYGGQNSWLKQAIVNDVLSYYRMPSGGIAACISGPSIVVVGSEEMKQEWLPKIALGEAGFWLAYSEPNAGSDLGSIKTTAVEDGDDFIVNGQKIWSSGAHVTRYGWMLAKTDPKARKHQSASLIIVDCDSPGITIRPIINIAGKHSFNEVYFDDVRVPKKNLVGELHKGFYNVMLALQFERLAVGSGLFRRVLDELVHYARTTVSHGQPLAKNPEVRRKLAAIAIEVEVFLGYYWRSVWMLDQGQVPELEASGLKLCFTELGRTMAGLAIDILGMYGQLDQDSKRAPFNGRVCLGYLDSISGPIGAGTSEVQRNIIATRGLGLSRG